MKKFHNTYINKSLGYWKDESKIEFVEIQPVHPRLQTQLYLENIKKFKSKLETKYPNTYVLLTA